MGDLDSLGYYLLKDQDIYFKDLQHIWQSLQDPVAVVQHKPKYGVLHRVYLRRPWGKDVRAIAEKDISVEAKTRLTAELCWRIYATVMYGDSEVQGEKPWESKAHKVWEDSRECPALMDRNKVPLRDRGNVQMGSASNDSKDYPRVILGEQVWLKGVEECRSPVVLQLHRFACWLSKGNPPAPAPKATHACGQHQCLRLHCLKWGNDKSNAKDREEMGRAGWKSRR